MISEITHNRARSPLTKVIMNEIKSSDSSSNKRSGSKDHNSNYRDNEIQDKYLDMKFHLSKSNSCNSRLELIGTETIHENNLNPTDVKSGKNDINSKDIKNDVNEEIVVNKYRKYPRQNTFFCIAPSKDSQQGRLNEWNIRTDNRHYKDMQHSMSILYNSSL